MLESGPTLPQGPRSTFNDVMTMLVNGPEAVEWEHQAAAPYSEAVRKVLIERLLAARPPTFWEKLTRASRMRTPEMRDILARPD